MQLILLKVVDSFIYIILCLQTVVLRNRDKSGRLLLHYATKENRKNQFDSISENI